MELDDFKSAWQELNAKVDQQKALNLHLLREGHADRAERRLRPLLRGQVLQMILGALLALGSAAFWTNHRHVPHLLATGLLMHAYALGLIFSGVRMQVLLRDLHFGAPVIEIQKRLARIRRFYIVSGLWVGLPWWFLWMPFMAMVFMGFFGFDMFARLSQAWIIGTLAIGVVGILLTFVLHRAAQKRPKLARSLDEALAGRSLAEVQRLLDEIARFEQE